MFKHINLRVFGGVFVVVVLLCATLHFYLQWDNKRFVAEIGQPHQFTDAAEPVAEVETEETQSVVQPTRIEPVEFTEAGESNTALDPITEPEFMVEDGSLQQTEPSETSSGFDATPLLSAFGVPDEVTALFDEEADAEDFEGARTRLVGEYGQSPEVEAIIDKLKQMSGGPVDLDDLIGLFEVWVRVLPPEAQENRRQLMGVLTQLQQVKASGGSAEARIEIHVVEDDISTD